VRTWREWYHAVSLDVAHPTTVVNEDLKECSLMLHISNDGGLVIGGAARSYEVSICCDHRGGVICRYWGGGNLAPMILRNLFAGRDGRILGPRRSRMSSIGHPPMLNISVVHNGLDRRGGVSCRLCGAGILLSRFLAECIPAGTPSLRWLRGDRARNTLRCVPWPS
jgi:hypothetical protein